MESQAQYDETDEGGGPFPGRSSDDRYTHNKFFVNAGGANPNSRLIAESRSGRLAAFRDALNRQREQGQSADQKKKGYNSFPTALIFPRSFQSLTDTCNNRCPARAIQFIARRQKRRMTARHSRVLAKARCVPMVFRILPNC